MDPFTYIFSRKNDGEPRAYSPEQRAQDAAFNAYYEAGGTTDWTSYTVEKLPCDAVDLHWPDTCWHYRITIR